MQCPYCATNNPAQARFCLHCGNILVQGSICRTCFTLLPQEARYCYHCGAPVIPTISSPFPPAQIAQIAPSAQTAPSSDLALTARPITELLPDLKRFLPAALYEPMERIPAPTDLAATRDHLSALLDTAKTYLPRPVIVEPQPTGVPKGNLQHGVFIFCDVSGFTPLSERLKMVSPQTAAERIAEIINSLFFDVVTALFNHGGDLLKFGGDAMLGVFPGDTPEQMAESALLAAQTGLAIQKVMEKYAGIDAAGEKRSLKIKCGIAAGPYFAAHIGTPPEPEKGQCGTMAYVTTGHTVNRTEICQGYAAGGEVTLTQEVYDLVRARVEAAPVETEGEHGEKPEGIYRLVSAPMLEGEQKRFILQEPPEGEVTAQITYLVERIRRLAPYMNSELIRRIVENPRNPRIAPDRRQVTVMFANYLGISDLVDALGEKNPQVVTQHLNNYFVKMTDIVEEYEGTVARMDQYAVGDRFIVFFGAPRAHEDDPVRAVYTALEMQQAMKEHFAALQTSEGIFRFRQRIGINTGVLFAGNAGAPDLRQEYTLMGDDINMAARLMSKSNWQEIFISDRTQERIAAYCETADKGEMQVKGKSIPVHVYQVLRRRAEIGQARGIAGASTSLIGRDEALQKLLAAGQNLLAGRGGLISVIGDSGLGKSRLLSEVRARLSAGEERPNLRWIHVQGLSFSEQVGYWLAAQMVRGSLDLDPAESDDKALLFSLWESGEKLLGKEKARQAMPFLIHMVGLELEGEWGQRVKSLDARVRQKQTLWAAREYFTALADQCPVLVVIDDLHFADEASLALFQDLLQCVVQAPLLLCFLYRPLRDKGCWRIHDFIENNFPRRHSELYIPPLPRPQSEELLGQLLPGALLSEAVRDEIHSKCAGNPFYIEEVVRSLIAGGAVVKLADDTWQVTEKMASITVPATLQGAIIARMDRLSEDVRQALQLAAVIGRRFQVEILNKLAAQSAELADWLAQLERSDLILPEQARPDAYIFPDALVQEVAYDNLLVQRRQEVHQRVGETLEAIFAAQAEQKGVPVEEIQAQECELLAYHFRLSNHREKAVRYLELAGKRAQGGFANATAVQHYSELLGLLDQDDSAWEKRFDILARRQRIHGLTGKQDARLADLNIMLESAQAHGDTFRAGDALNELADLYQSMGRYDEAKATASEALAIKVGLNDIDGQADALNTLGILEYFRGNYTESQPLLEQAVALRKQITDGEGEAWSTMYLGMIHVMQGDFSAAARLHAHALELAEARQDMFQTGIHVTNLARVLLGLGDYPQAIEKLQHGLEMKTRIGDRMGQGFNLYLIGLALIYEGRLDEAESWLNRSKELREQIKDSRGLSYCLHGLGLLALERQNWPQAVELLALAHQSRAGLGLKNETIESLSYLAKARLLAGDPAQALADSTQAVEGMALQKEMQEAPQIYFNHARILQANQIAAYEDYENLAREAIDRQAQRIADPQEREIFLTRNRMNCEILAPRPAK